MPYGPVLVHTIASAQRWGEEITVLFVCIYEDLFSPFGFHSPFPSVARRHGGRLYLLFFTSILHGLVVESLSYVLPEIDNFWHGVSSITMFKQRLPLHILLFCELVILLSNLAL